MTTNSPVVLIFELYPRQQVCSVDVDISVQRIYPTDVKLDTLAGRHANVPPRMQEVYLNLADLQARINRRHMEIWMTCVFEWMEPLLGLVSKENNDGSAGPRLEHERMSQTFCP